jgi:hypothetical protein
VSNERRMRQDFLNGFVSDNPLTIGATTLNSSGLTAMPVINTTNYMVITLDPVSANPEIIYVTAHTASAASATIVRGREGSTARQHAQNTRWTHAPTRMDHDYSRSYATRLYLRQNFR